VQEVTDYKSLRSIQAKALFHLHRKDDVILLSTTGTGKSVVYEMFGAALDKGKVRVLLLIQ
jgi:superfamily II DNA helicase RecQ